MDHVSHKYVSVCPEMAEINYSNYFNKSVKDGQVGGWVGGRLLDPEGQIHFYKTSLSMEHITEGS